MAKLDRALLGPPSPDGTVPFVRNQDGEMSLCVGRPLREGQPVHGEGELVQFQARPEAPGVYDCTTLWDTRSPAPVKTEAGGQEPPAVAKPPEQETTRTHDGPPKVTTRDYREGWDAIFKKRDLN